MGKTIDIYVNKENKTYVDQLQAICNINDEPFSSAVGTAIKYYIMSLEGKVPLVANKKYWKLDDMSNEELLETNRLLCSLNYKITKKLCNR